MKHVWSKLTSSRGRQMPKEREEKRIEEKMLIKEFYKNQDIFITGGSGFIGKALIEKLLRSCPGFSKIYVLLRDKRGKSANDRLQEILKTKLFHRARREQPEAFERVEAVVGDCTELGLGLSKGDLQKLQNVSIIFHSAASVRFDETLNDAVILNTRGTREMLQIAETMRKLKVFVHVSTTYCNPNDGPIEEKVYKCCADWRETIKIAETVDEDTLNSLTLKYDEFKLNTYVFSKSLGEEVVKSYKDKLPVIIYRPSIVVSSWFEPIPGWIDNFNGPVGVLIACGIGILRTNDYDGSKVSAIVPVDIVVRGLIIAAYKRGIETPTNASNPDRELEVYNCAIDSLSPISMEYLTEMCRQRIMTNPFERTLWLPGGGFTRCPLIFFVKFFFLQVFGSIIYDMFLVIGGAKPMVLKLQRKMRHALKSVGLFMSQEWNFKVDNFFGLENWVPKSEYDDFAFLEKSNIDFDKFVNQGIRGGKEFLLNESPESSLAARRRLMLFKVLHYGSIGVFSVLSARFVLRWVYSNFIRV